MVRTMPSDKPPVPVPSPVPPAARFIAGVFGFVFFGIGLTVLGFVWSGDALDDMPFFLRLFPSFIALAFVAFGGTMAYSAVTGGGLMAAPSQLLAAQQRARDAAGATADAPAGPTAPPLVQEGQYVCPHCGAKLGDRVDVSPLGDVKCQFCGAWFNVHGRGR